MEGAGIRRGKKGLERFKNGADGGLEKAEKIGYGGGAGGGRNGTGEDGGGRKWD